MYAVIETGSKQYRVQEGDIIQVERLQGKTGDKLLLEKVLMIGDETGKPKLGTPYLESSKVEAEIVKQGRSKKVIIYKKKRRKGYEVKKTHRQYYTEIKITQINE